MKHVTQKIETSGLIKELLNLDHDTLEALCPSTPDVHDRALAGLAELMRKSMQLTVILRDRKDLTLHLHGHGVSRTSPAPISPPC